jgi:hypothetical protein
MRTARLGLVACACAALSCAGEPFRGGHAAPDVRPPRMKTLGAFIPGHCEDAAHADRAPRVSAVELLESPMGRPLLFEHRQGHEVLIAENFFDDGPFWVFEVIVKSENLVREWRIPRSPGATGTLLVGRELAEVAHGERFEAKLASATLTCSLVPKTSDLPSGSPTPVR